MPPPPTRLAFLSAYRQANLTITADDAADGFRTANVAGAFDTYDTATVVWHGATARPRTSRAPATLTWSCSPPPINHNIHPDSRGYGVIAREFELVIGRL